MALLDTLRDRTGFRGGTAQVDCGELGVLTVEALPPAECFQLSGDSRALLYAACRELQQVGETLRQEGKIFRPDEVTAYLTAEEAEAAAMTVLELSGMRPDGAETGLEPDSAWADAPVTGLEPAATWADSSAVSEIRPQSVQTGLGTETAIRPESVQGNPPAGTVAAGTDGAGLWAGEAEIRLSSVQSGGADLAENGQVSREFFRETAIFPEGNNSDKKAQILGDSTDRTAQIMGGTVDSTRSIPTAGTAVLHEIESESRGGAALPVHETESESQGRGRAFLHETESELRRNRLTNLHDITSDFDGREGRALHETESEEGWILHEIRSELRKAMHEIKSEVREMMHESESELAEAAAERLAEALTRAAQVR